MEEFIETEAEWVETLQEWNATPGDGGGTVSIFGPFYYEMLMQGEL